MTFSKNRLKYSTEECNRVFLKPRNLLRHIRRFDASVKRYRDRYVPLVFDGVPGNNHYVYVFPLCTKEAIVVDQVHGQGATMPFTLDHYPPKNIAGKATVLVCKDCNNRADSDFENALYNKVRQEAFRRQFPGSIVDVTISFENAPGKRYGILHYSKEQLLQFQLRRGGNAILPPLTSWQHETNNNGKGFKARIELVPIDNGKVGKALLKAAYLYCFVALGYDFAFSSTAKIIRNVIFGSERYPVDVGWIWLDHQTPEFNPQNLQGGLYFIQNPNALVVPVPLALKDINYYCVVPVLIPSPEDNSIDHIVFVNDELKASIGKPINYRGFDDFLEQGCINAYSRAWDVAKGAS